MPPELWNDIHNVVVGLAGGVVAIAVLVFTKFGHQVLDFAMDRNIEKLKHGFETEVERLKSRLAHFSDRSVRSNELEYDAITTAWSKLDETYRATNGCITRFHEHPDFNRMSEEQLERFLAASQLTGETRLFIKDAKDKNAAWIRVDDLRADPERTESC